MVRDGKGVVRSGFRTRDGKGAERLPVGVCRDCGEETYQVPAGAWLHWSTLTDRCPRVAAVTAGKGRSGD